MVVGDQRVIVHPKAHAPSTSKVYFTIGSVDSFERRLEELQNEFQPDPHKHVPVVYERPSFLLQLLFSFGPTILFALALFYFYSRFNRSNGSSRGSGGNGMSNMFGFGRTRAEIAHPELVSVKFSDVAGMDEAKEEITEFVKFLKNPEAYKKLGAKIPKGALLTGPPGTGKTLLAKVIFSISSPSSPSPLFLERRL